MKYKIIKNATIVNEGKITHGDILIKNDRIEKIAPVIDIKSSASYHEINADKLHLIPGMIDAHVHFREPGYPHKGNIRSESAAAIAGGVTSFMDMPNTLPSVLTREILLGKFNLASQSSYCNYSFFMGLSRDNLEEALKVSTEDVCGLTDDGLYFDDHDGLLCNHHDYLEKLFSRTEHLVALHSENKSIIDNNLKKFQGEYGELIPPQFHRHIRSADACLSSTEGLVSLAKKYTNRLHILHVSTEVEANLFSNELPLREKRLTAETCVHYLIFNESDYEQKGNFIKWNPSIKTKKDQDGILQALCNDRIDFIATDHAPHSFREKTGNYLYAKSGAPMVQHALPAMLQLYHQGKISLEKIVQKTSHHVADTYRIKERGYIREGYYADLALIDLNATWVVSIDNLMYGCHWSPLVDQSFKGKIKKVMVNGNLIYENMFKRSAPKGMQLKFEKIR